MNSSIRLSVRPRIRLYPLHGNAAAEPEHSPEAGQQLRRAIFLARQWLLSHQSEEGFWEGELEGDTILESEYILLLAFHGQQDSSVALRASKYILDKQLPDGGWAIYPGGQLDISASVKAYFALKLTGQDPSSPPMQLARSAILRHGGADQVNSFTRFYLALLGQISYQHCPNVPPEFILFPGWFPVNLYSISAWSRTILVPLSIISAMRPVKQLQPELGIRELFLRAPEDWPPLRCPGKERNGKLLSWDRFFRFMDRAFHFLQGRKWTPMRKYALSRAEKWMIERFDGSDGLGAIFPPMVWSSVALRCLGYAEANPEWQYCQRKLDGLLIDDGETVRLQPCKSPVWDTAFSVRALVSNGIPADHPAITKAIDWLQTKESRRHGDWSHKVKSEPSGWYFEHANEFYPDVDDTAAVLMALKNAIEPTCDTDTAVPLELHVPKTDVKPHSNSARKATSGSIHDRILQALSRGESWIRSMQNRDGGWGAFDKDNNAEFLCNVPFADHNAMIDPSSPDLAARVLESLGQLGRRHGDPQIDRCIEYLRQAQEPDGSWFGRWGVNYIYGTWQVLVGMAAVGISSEDEVMTAGANWLLAHQQPCGGWGETPRTYEEPHLRGQGPPTASQTAWALLGLMAAGMADHPAVARGFQFLLDRQNVDGIWDEEEFTGTGFPQVFYLRYHLYPVYFPLLALAQWARHGGYKSVPVHSRTNAVQAAGTGKPMLVGA